MTTWRRSRLQSDPTFVGVAAIALAALTASVLLANTVMSAGKSEASIACGADKNQVVDEFDVDRPSDVWKYLPAMLQAPELMDDPTPAHVVVFEGPFKLEGLNGAADDTAPVVNDVVCVVQSDGTVNLYDGVSRAGAKLP